MIGTGDRSLLESIFLTDGRDAQDQRRADCRGSEVRQFGQQATARHLRAPGRSHSYADFTLWALVEALDDGGPVFSSCHGISNPLAGPEN